MKKKKKWTRSVVGEVYTTKTGVKIASPEQMKIGWRQDSDKRRVVRYNHVRGWLTSKEEDSWDDRHSGAYHDVIFGWLTDDELWDLRQKEPRIAP